MIEQIAAGIALLGFFGVLGLYLWGVSWAINDARQRGESGFLPLILCWLIGPFAIILWRVSRPPTTLAERPPQVYGDPDEALAAASRLDSLGEWDAAIKLYEDAAVRWPEHKIYAAACIQRIVEKKSFA